MDVKNICFEMNGLSNLETNTLHTFIPLKKIAFVKASLAHVYVY